MKQLKHNFIKPYFILLSLFLSFYFFSCNNFLDGSNLKNEIDQAVEYASSKEFILRVIPELPKMGTVTTATEIRVKKTDNIEISFEASEDYCFDHWEVLDKSTLKPVENVIEIKDKYKNSTSATVVSEYNEIILRPVCQEYIKVVSFTPNDTLGAVAKDRSIIITLNQEIDESNFFYTAEEFLEKGWFEKYDWGMGYTEIYPVSGFEPLYIKDNSYYYVDYATTKYYGYRLNGETFYKGLSIRCEAEDTESLRDYRPYYPNIEITDNQIILKADKNNIIPLYGNETKVITVELDKNLISNTSQVGMKDNYQMCYSINSNYMQPVKITVEEDLFVEKNGTKSPSNALYINIRDDENFEYPYVGDTIDLALVLTDDTKYDFNYWDYDSKYIKIEDSKSQKTTATILEGVEEIKLTLIYKIKPIQGKPYDFESPYLETISIYDEEKDSVGHVKNIEYINMDSPQLYTKDSFTIDLSAYDYASSYDVRGSGIQYIKIEEQLIETRDGINVETATDTTYTTYYDTSDFESNYVAIQPYWHDKYSGYISGYSDHVKMKQLYKIKTPEDGLIKIKVFLIDYAGNCNKDKTKGDKNFTFYKINNVLNDDYLVVTNEPEEWEKDEWKSSYYNFTRTSGVFSIENFEQEICNLRWALRIRDVRRLINSSVDITAVNFDDSQIQMFLKVNDGNETLVSCIDKSESTEFNYYGLNYKYTLDSSLFDNPEGIKLTFRIKDKINNTEKTFYRFIPGPANIKGITEKKFPVAPDSYTTVAGPSRSVFVDKTLHPDNTQDFRTCSFVLDEQPLGSVDTANKYFTYGIENGIVIFKDHYGYTFENVLKVGKGNICAFNYYGEVFYPNKTTFKAYDSDTDCTTPFYNPNINSPKRLFGKTGTYWFDEDSTSETTSVETTIGNTEALSVSNVEFKTVDQVNTDKMKIIISLNDSHANSGDHEIINFVSIYGYRNSDEKQKYLTTAYYDESSGKYFAYLPSSLRSSNNGDFEISSFVLKPYRMVIKDNKSSTFEGTVYYTKDNSNNLSDVAGKSILFNNDLVGFRYEETEKEYTNPILFEDMVMGTRLNGIDAVALVGIRETSGKKYNVEYWLADNITIYDSVIQNAYAEGKFKTGLVAYNAPSTKLLPYDSAEEKSYNSVYFGIPTWDIIEYDEGERSDNGPSGDSHNVVLRISDEAGNYKFLTYSFRSKIIKKEYTPTYDFTSLETINKSIDFSKITADKTAYWKSRLMGKSMFYYFDGNNWNYENCADIRYQDSYISENAKNVNTVIQSVKQKADDNGRWIKYYSTLGYWWKAYYTKTYHYEGSPSYWQYAYIPKSSDIPKCKSAPSIIGSAGGAMISGDVPALVYTVASSYNRDKSENDWDIRTKQISPKIVDLSSEKTLNIYAYDVSELPEGWYYKIFARFPDGTVISTPVQKNDCN